MFDDKAVKTYEVVETVESYEDGTEATVVEDVTYNSAEDDEGDDTEDLTGGQEGLTVCEDDPDFLYKGRAGQDCVYLATNAPEKCAKSHNGEKIGVADCPVSCDMVDECKESYRSSGTVSDAEAVVTGASSPPELAVTVPAAKSATGASSPPELAEPSPVCADDPTFLYKDKPGYDCAYIGRERPEKCAKVHNGNTVGAVDCPESCGMVQECLLAAAARASGSGYAASSGVDDVGYAGSKAASPALRASGATVTPPAESAREVDQDPPSHDPCRDHPYR